MKTINLAKILRPILTATEYAIAVLIVAVSAQIMFGNNLETWIITIISICLAVLTSIIWYSDGVERGEQVASVYNTTLRYHTYARAILNKQDFDKIREFCVKKNAQYEQDLMSAKLGQHELTLKNLSDYKDARRIARETAEIKPKTKIGNILIGKRYNYTDENYKKLRKGYTKEQLRILDRLCEKKIRFKHLQVKDVIRANDKTESLVPENTEKQVLPRRIIGKIAWGAMIGLFTAGVVFTQKGEWTINETIQVITWAFSISMNIYTSIRTGYKSVTINRYQYYKAKNEICIEYFAYANIKTEDVEKDLDGKLKQS